MATSNGSGSPPSPQVLEERPTALGVFLRARRQVQEHLRAVGADPPRTKDRFARLASAQPFGNAVHEQVDHRGLGQIARGEVLVLCPEPLGHLRDCRPREHRLACLVAEDRLDVPRRKTPRVHLDSQLLDGLRPLPELFADPRPERLRSIGDLRRAVLDDAFGRLQPCRSRPIAIAAAGFAAALVVAPTQGIRDLGLQSLLHDLPHAQLHDFGQGLAIRQISEQLTKPLTRSLRRGYSHRHGDASSPDAARRRPGLLVCSHQ